MPTLRPYQAKLKAEIYAAWSGFTRERVVMAVAATGSGKTVLFSDILQEHAGVSCAIAHRQELVNQISLALARNGVRHRIIGPTNVRKFCERVHLRKVGRSYVDQNARCAVAGVDTLLNLDERDPWFMSVTKWVCDEGHHLLRDNKWGKAVARFPNALGLLVTATPIRADGKGLGRTADGVVDVMVVAPSMRDLINMGYLTDYRIVSTQPTDLDLSHLDISTATGDFNKDQVRKAIHKSTQIVGDVVGHYLKWAQGKLGITFAVDVEEAIKIATAFKAAGVPAEVVHAKTPDDLRVEIVQRFERREILQLVNVDLFGEGFDLPAIEVVSFARPTASFSLYAQQFGRALRLLLDPSLLAGWDGYSDAERRYFISLSTKPKALIIDHVGNVLRHKLPDARNDWSLERRERRGSSKPSDAIPLRTCLDPDCLQPYERVYKCCPYCGNEPEPPARSSPEYVDGALDELAPEVLALMRGEIQRIDNAFVAVPSGAAPEVAGAIKKRHRERQEAQRALRAAVAWWSGYELAHGRGDAGEQYRRFYFMFGTDVGTAQTLGTKDAGELREKIAAYMAQRGVDVTLDAGLTTVN